MTLKRLTSFDKNSKEFLAAYELYKSSFPVFEQRNETAQKQVLACKEYHFDILHDGQQFVGMILYWEAYEFIYVEHFCINTELRGKGYGQQILEIMSKKRKTIILEIDPPINDVAIRRKHFYIKLGYKANSFNHVHPPYNPNFEGHSLEVLSYPSVIDNEMYKLFDDYIKNTVMQII